MIATAHKRMPLPSYTAEQTFVGDLNFREEQYAYRDKSVPVSISTYVKSAFLLTQRQLWLLVKLQDEEKPNTGTISRDCQVSRKTANVILHI